jgi:glycosyltransferase involved in cell wall biosynthesis
MPKISLCMIVKNEEANLEACLRPVCGLVDEIVVVDTGSTDRTKEIASDLGARVFDFLWCDDFSAARNESLRHARGEWAFWLDADHHMDEANLKKLERLFGELTEPAAYWMTELSDDSGKNRGITHPRLFKLAPDVRWKYRVHEQIAPALMGKGFPLRETDIVIRHTGYRSPEVVRQKMERNLRLLLLDIAEHPNDTSVRLHLGKSYVFLARYAEAVPLLLRALSPLGPHNPEARFVLRHLVDSLRGIARLDLAQKHCLQGLQWFPDDVYLREMERSLVSGPQQVTVSLPQALNVALHYYEAGRLEDAEQQYQQILQAYPNQVDALHLLGVIAGRTGRPARAVDYLQATLRLKPDFAAVHNSLGNVFVLQRRLPEAVASFRQAVRCQPDFAAAHSNLGNALRELGQVEQGIASLQECLRLDPDLVGARDNLSIALQTQQRLNNL